MFNNPRELKEEILSGKKTEDIVKERVAYLNSEEYQSKLYQRIGSPAVQLLNGYIMNGETVSLYDFHGSTSYAIDDENFLNEIVDTFKANSNKKLGIPQMMYFIKSAVRNYCTNQNNSAKYYDLCKPLQNPREDFGKVLNEYLSFKHTGIDLSQKEFMQYYLSYENGILEKIENEKAKEMFKAFDTYEKDDNNFLNTVISISDIRGLGIGMCVEMSALSQNVLSFLGFNSFMVQGYANNVSHQFNAVEINGKYYIFDAAIYETKFEELDFIKKPEDLLTFGSYKNYTSRQNNLNEIKKLAVKGKDYRHFAESSLQMFQNYKDLQNKDSKGEK